MKTHASFMLLVAELDGDLVEFYRIRALNIRAWDRVRSGSGDVLDYGALGYTLHSLYGIMENYFLRISKFFENNLPSAQWHRVLVERMSLEIDGVRPKLITDTESRRLVNELLKFRHRFRNLYGEDLDPVRTESVQHIAESFAERFGTIHDEFKAKMITIAKTLP